MLLDEIMNANRKFISETTLPVLDHHPHKHLAVVTCMDTRLLEALEPLLGIKRGEALEIRNAGNTVTEDRGDVIRSLVGAVYQLGVKEVLVVGHTNCGMAGVDTEGLAAKMRAAGVTEAAIAELDLPNWIGTFASEEENVIRTVERIKASPYLPAAIPVHGLLLDIGTGMLHVLVNGYQKE
ncbi:MAG: beta-class carbonic anhydrase [bacterium]|jgi:carbonic anhydrase